MRLTFVLLLLAILPGCADTHLVTRASGTSSALERDLTAYVRVPTDGSYGRTAYTGSGGLAAQAVAAAFSPFLSKVTVGLRSESLDEARKSAQSGGFSYLVFPEILHWEDRNTAWSGMPDQVSVKVSVIRVDTGAVLDSAVVAGTSGLATFGGDRPEHLLPKPLSDYVGTLFRK